MPLHQTIINIDTTPFYIVIYRILISLLCKIITIWWSHLHFLNIVLLISQYWHYGTNSVLLYDIVTHRNFDPYFRVFTYGFIVDLNHRYRSPCIVYRVLIRSRFYIAPNYGLSALLYSDCAYRVSRLSYAKSISVNIHWISFAQFPIGSTYIAHYTYSVTVSIRRYNFWTRKPSLIAKSSHQNE